MNNRVARAFDENLSAKGWEHFSIGWFAVCLLLTGRRQTLFGSSFFVREQVRCGSFPNRISLWVLMLGKWFENCVQVENGSPEIGDCGTKMSNGQLTEPTDLPFSK
jgi:hypothetical protein